MTTTIVTEDELTDMFGEGGKEEVKEAFAHKETKKPAKKKINFDYYKCDACGHELPSPVPELDYDGQVTSLITICPACGATYTY